MCNMNHGPGKFEGESCITKQAYEWMLNSGEDDITDDGWLAFNGPFGPFDINQENCEECYQAIKKAKRVLLYQDTLGFCYSKVE